MRSNLCCRRLFCQRGETSLGFTLVEMMVTLMIMSVLVALAYPNLRNMTINTRVSDTTNELVVSLNLARSESVKRGMSVTVVANENDWTKGWNVQTLDSTPEVLRTQPALEDGQTIMSTGASVTFGSAGTLSGSTSFGLRVCRPAAYPDATESRLVTVRGSGLISSRRRGAADPTDPVPAAGCP
jgi:type IV fimbrial biogenesis protein FimT